METSQQIRRNSEPSFSTVRSSLETAHRPHTSESCGDHMRVPPQSPPGIRRLLYGCSGFSGWPPPTLTVICFFFHRDASFKIFNGTRPFFILEETLSSQHGAHVGLQKKRNFVTEHNKMGRHKCQPIPSGALSQDRRITAILRRILR